MFNFGMDIGIDLGTANIYIYVKNRGIVLREPSVVAIDKNTNSILAIGDEARRMLGRTPGNIVAIRPLREGVIADYQITESMLKYFIRKVCGKRRFFRPRVMVCVPSGVTEVEKRAVKEAAMQAGARKTYLIEEPMAAAIGSGLPIVEPNGSMVIDIGGGTTDIAVISLGGIVVSDSIRVAGDKFDEAIIRYIRKVYNLMIGERTSEDIKIKIGSAILAAKNQTLEIKGRDLVTGLPKTVSISSMETYEALSEPVSLIVEGVKRVLEKTPPELAADIIERGIMMTGGGSLLSGFADLVSKETQIAVYVAEDPLSCVAIGTGICLEKIEVLNELQKSGTRMTRKPGIALAD